MRFGFKFFTNDSIEKSKKGVRRSNHKYIRVFTGNNGKDEYIYPEDMKNPFKKLLSIFAITKEKIANVFKNEKIEENYGVDENTFAAHVLEYLTDRVKWDKFFSNPTVAHKNKKPVNLEKKEKDPDKEKTVENKEKTEKKESKKPTINRSLMRKIWAIFNPAKEQDSEAMFNSGSTASIIPAAEKIKDFVGRKTTVDSKTKVTTMKWPDGREIKVDGKGNILYDSANPVVEEPETAAPENPIEEHDNRSKAMLGNDNAKKDIHAEEPEEDPKMAADKAESNMLVNRLAELDKEYKANGGNSYKRTTREQDEKRRAAQKETDVVEEKLREFKARIREENKDNDKLPDVYKDGVNEWLKRKAKGQTISDEWIRKKFGGYQAGHLPFGNKYEISLENTENVENPVVNILYRLPNYSYEKYITVDIGEMGKEDYRPRYMGGNNINDPAVYNDVVNRFHELQEKVKAAPGSTPAEKFYNMILNEDNEYNKTKGLSDVPRYRFTKDGIKDKGGNLKKIRANLEKEGTPEESIWLVADDYGNCIPSIFYPENDTDSQTDYFDNDSCYIKPDHPYYNHLKVMALKHKLYQGRATKWGKMSEADQKELEKKIKDLEKTLTEPTDEELAAYRTRRDHEEELKEQWKQAEKNVYYKEQAKREKEKEAENANKLFELLNKFAEAIAKEPPVNLNGLTKDEKIEVLEDRIFKLGMEIKNLTDPETIESKTQFKDQLTEALAKIREEPDTIVEKTAPAVEPEKPVRSSTEVANELADVKRKMFTAEDEEMDGLKTRLSELNEELKEATAREISAEEHQNRSQAMLGNQNAYKGLTDTELKLKQRQMGEEVGRLIAENEKLYDDNSGFSRGSDDNPDSDYQKWLRNAEKARNLKAEIGKITDERTSRNITDSERTQILNEHKAAYDGIKPEKGNQNTYKGGPSEVAKYINGKTTDMKERNKMLSAAFSERYGTDPTYKYAQNVIGQLLLKVRNETPHSDGWYKAVNDYNDAAEMYKMVIGDKGIDFYNQEMDKEIMKPNYNQETIPEPEKTPTEQLRETVDGAKQQLSELESQIGQGNGFELDKKIEAARQKVHEKEMEEKDQGDGITTPIPTIDPEVARRISDISMSGTAGSVYQHDVNVEMKEFRDMFDVTKMNEQQKAYFQERLNSYASLVGSSYGEMASKRLAAGPSWAVAGPAKYNNKRFAQKMESERRAYENFTEKKEKFIKNTEKELKRLKYQGGAESEEDVKQRVFEDYANGNYSWNDKVDNTDPYAIEKISGKIKYMENAHDVTLMYGKNCKKAGITTMSWADRTEEDNQKRKAVMLETIKAAKEKGYSNKQIKQGMEHPFPQNQNQEIARNKKRLEELKARKAAIDVMANRTEENGNGASATPGRVDFDGGYVYENLELDRIQIIYDGKPDKDTISKLKHNGFHWTPSQGAWQRQLNRNGRSAVNRVFEETGVDKKIDIDGAGEVKKSDQKEDEMFIKAFEYCDLYLNKSYEPGDTRTWKGKTFIMNYNGKWERYV